MSEVLSAILLPRRKTSSQWAADLVPPRLGEVCIEVNTPMSFKIGDGITLYSALPYPPGFSGALTLQQVLTAGNTGTTPHNLIVLDDGVNISNTRSNSYLIKTESGLTLCLLGVIAGVPILQLSTSDATKKATIIADTLLTADRTYLMPDEGNTGDVNSAFVLHQTKDPITITDGTVSNILTKNSITIQGYVKAIGASGQQAELNGADGQIQSIDVNGDGVGIGRNSGVSGLHMYQLSSGKIGRITLPALTGNRIYTLPDASGTLALAGSTGDLNAVLSSGNTANNDLILDNGSGVVIKLQNSVSNIQISDGTQVTIIGKLGGHQVVFLSNDAGSGQAVIYATNTTTGRRFDFDDLSGNIAVRQNGGNYTSASVSSAFIVVAHGMPFTPNRVMLSARSLTTAQAFSGGYYISAISSSSFTVTFVVPLSATAMNFDFQCD